MGVYDDIIDLPHHVSERHPHMPLIDRAAQFSPFAALTGYESEVKEAARLTEKKTELSEEQIAILDERLRLLEDILPEQPEIAFTYFQPDTRKEGGAYTTVLGKLKRIDRVERSILLTSGLVIHVEELLQVEGEIFGDE